MPTKFVCLANSFKEGGRCLAGIELDVNNNPVLSDGKPKWIRPVCDTPHGEVPGHLVSHLYILDIIEIEVTGIQQANYQSENVFFRQDSIRGTGTFDRNGLSSLCDNRELIFNNRGKAVSQEAITSLNYSLMLVKTRQFEVIKKTYEDSPDRTQFRMAFLYNDIQYDFPITDPVFLHRYQLILNFLNKFDEAYLSLSLGIVWANWYYKLIVGIILINNTTVQKATEQINDFPF